MRKKIKYTLVAMAFAVFVPSAADAQHYFGVRAGIGGGTGRFRPHEEMGTVWGLYSGGVSWKFYTDEKIVGGIEADLLWMQQGFKVFRMATVEGFEEQQRVGYDQRTVDVIMLPVFWQPHVYMFKQRIRIFLNAGVTFSYVLSSKQEIADLVNNTVERSTYEMKTTRDNRVGYGLCGGGGVSWLTGRLEIFAEARYYIGYADILRNHNKYEGNPTNSPLDGLQIAVGAYWRIGKGGIRSGQGRQVTDEMIRSITNGNDIPVKTNGTNGEDGAAEELPEKATDEAADGGDDAAGTEEAAEDGDGTAGTGSGAQDDNGSNGESDGNDDNGGGDTDKDLR